MKKDIAREIDRIKIIDTHEHLRMSSARGASGIAGVFELFANRHCLYRTNYYVWADLVSSGMNLKTGEKKFKDCRAAYRAVAPYLAYLKTSSYFLSFAEGLKELHGFNRIPESEKEWLALDRKVRAAYRKPEWELSVLKDRAGIERMFYSYGWKCQDRNFFAPVLRMDNYFNLAYRTWPTFQIVKWPRGWEEDHEFTLEELGIRVKNFDDFLGSIEKIFHRAKKEKVVAVKMGSAYSRSLKFEPASLDLAHKIFGERTGKVSDEDARAFENATLPLLIKKCIEYDLPLQFHTGFLAGNAGPADLAGTNPLFLQNLIVSYPEAKFSLFHGGYPYLRESLALGKKYPNVYLDFCWLPLISYSAAKTFLSEALETVPANKIMWGGDCHNVEAICGATLVVRRLLAEVLEDKIEKKVISRLQAVELARKILHDNAARLFRLR